MTLQDKEILDFLDLNQPFTFNDIKRHSSVVLALRDCRAITKRDLNSGKLNNESLEGYPGNWLGAIGYFALLDLFGSTFKKLADIDKADNKNSIGFAIESFGFDFLNNDSDELEAIIGLRNSFTHNFNLLNINPRNLKKRHKFKVTWNNDDTVVALPSEKWDGIIAVKDFSKTYDQTSINLFGFGNMVESIYYRIIEGIKLGTITIQGDILTVINKYSIIIF